MPFPRKLANAVGRRRRGGQGAVQRIAALELEEVLQCHRFGQGPRRRGRGGDDQKAATGWPEGACPLTKKEGQFWCGTVGSEECRAGLYSELHLGVSEQEAVITGCYRV